MKQVLEFDDPTVSEPVRVQNEPFAYLLVDVAEEGRTLYDGLDTVFDDSPVEIEGKKAQRRVSLLELPPVLQVQLQVRETCSFSVGLHVLMHFELYY